MDNTAAGKFINSIVKNLQLLCHSDIQFNENVEIIGHLYLNVDSGSKYNYFVNEKVCKSDETSTTFVSNSFHAEPAKVNHNSDTAENSNLKSKDNISEQNLDVNIIQNSKPKLFAVSRRTERYKNGSSRNPPGTFTDIYSPNTPTKRPRMNSSQSSDDIPRIKIEPDKDEDFNQFNLSSASHLSKKDTLPHSNNNSQPSSQQHYQQLDLTSIKSEPKPDSDVEEIDEDDENMTDSIRNQGGGSIYGGDEESLSDYSATNEQLLNFYTEAINQQHTGSSRLPHLPSSSSSHLYSSPSQQNVSATNFISLDDGSYSEGQKSGSKRIVCEMCGASFSRNWSLKRHLKEKHLQIKHPCSYCPALFSRQIYLEDHVKNMHQDKEPDSVKVSDIPFDAQCNYCPAKFPLEGLLQEHIQSSHNAEGLDLNKLGLL